MAVQLNADYARSVFQGIINQHDVRESQRMRDEGSHVVHYTSAANCLNVINGATLWMRNAKLMNDWSEIDYGKWVVNGALGQLQQAWHEVLDAIHQGLGALTLGQYHHFENFRTNSTYILSLSEHLSREDDLGRLSMWRAYGGDSGGIAFVFDIDAIQQKVPGLNIVATIVRYKTLDQFVPILWDMLSQLKAVSDVIRAIPPVEIAEGLGTILHYFVLSTKHPSFEEEREIRLISSPHASTIAYLEVETVNGVPQAVLKLPLRDDLQVGYRGALSSVLRRIIVGPVAYPPIVNEAICLQLQQRAGIPAPQPIVHSSWVPLRKAI